jgi:hypothetical protein
MGAEGASVRDFSLPGNIFDVTLIFFDMVATFH